MFPMAQAPKDLRHRGHIFGAFGSLRETRKPSILSGRGRAAVVIDSLPVKRLWVAAVPFLVSLLLSATTIGPHLYWQDSGFFLVAVRELGILYPTGFALYLLLCKAWTILLFFVNFTLAVHLFSALCAALAAGTLAQAARELLQSRGPLFRVVPDGDATASTDWTAAAIGCLAACGYTFWSAALLAKVYAFYYLILSLLLWRMIRADATGSKRDLTIVAALIGLAWQAHPSATTTGAALVLFVLSQRRAVGWGGIAARLGVAAACALGPILVLPLLASREPALMFGDPRNLAGFKDYVLGSRFTEVPGVFGIAPTRVASVGRYFWEEVLGVGLVLVVAGLVRLARVNRRLLLGLAAWVVPVVAVTVLFKMEGQHDFWFVAAWLPLWLVAAVGLHAVARAAKERGPLSIGAAAAAGMIWALAANHADLNVRNYTLPEKMGRFYLEPLDPGAVLVVRSDNVLATTLYAQRIAGVRPDVAIVSVSELQDAARSVLLVRRHPFLKEPMGSFIPPQDRPAFFALVNGQNPEHPLYFEFPPPAASLPREIALAPAGPMKKVVPAGQEHVIDPKYWREPLPAEELVRLDRRARAQFNEYLPNGIRVTPETFEHRFLRDLVRARQNLADWHARSGAPDGFSRSAQIYESIVALDPGMKGDRGVVYNLAGAYFGMKRYDLAEPWLQRALELELPPAHAAQVCGFLAVLCRDTNRPDDAARWAERARSYR